jgi:hypothetical protein
MVGKGTIAQKQEWRRAVLVVTTNIDTTMYQQYVGFGVFLCDEKLDMCYSIA